MHQIDLDAKDVIPIFVDALKNEDPVVRQWAAISLGNIGSDAKAATLAILAPRLRVMRLNHSPNRTSLRNN